MQKTLNRSHTAYRRTYFIVTIYITKRHVMITLAFVLLVARTKKQKPFKVKLPVFFIHSSHFCFLLTECFSTLINRSSSGARAEPDVWDRCHLFLSASLCRNYKAKLNHTSCKELECVQNRSDCKSLVRIRIVVG